MMRRTLVLGGLWVLMSVPASAETLVGRVNTTITRLYTFTMVGGGQAGITLSWLDGRADLVMTLVCGDSEPVVFGSATGEGLNRFAQINAGIPPFVPCEVGVTASRNGSKYYINVMQQADSSIRARGREPRTAASVFEPASSLTPVVVEQLEKLVRATR